MDIIKNFDSIIEELKIKELTIPLNDIPRVYMEKQQAEINKIKNNLNDALQVYIKQYEQDYKNLQFDDENLNKKKELLFMLYTFLQSNLNEILYDKNLPLFHYSLPNCQNTIKFKVKRLIIINELYNNLKNEL